MAETALLKCFGNSISTQQSLQISMNSKGDNPELSIKSSEVITSQILFSEIICGLLSIALNNLSKINSHSNYWLFGDWVMGFGSSRFSILNSYLVLDPAVRNQ